MNSVPMTWKATATVIWGAAVAGFLGTLLLDALLRRFRR